MAEVSGQNFQVGGTPRAGYGPVVAPDGSLSWQPPSPGAQGIIVSAAESPYAALPGQTVLVDASLGAVEIDLPPAPPEGTVVVVKNVAQESSGGLANNLTEVDTLDGSLFTHVDGDSSRLLMPVTADAETFVFSTASGFPTWYIAASHLPVLAVPTQANPPNPSGTTDTTGVMMGLTVSSFPGVNGKLLVSVSGDCFNSTIADGVTITLYSSTSPNTNGDPLTGTAFGNPIRCTAAAANDKTPFSITAVVTGATYGAQLFVDAAVAAVAGGTATIENLTVVTTPY